MFDIVRSLNMSHFFTLKIASNLRKEPDVTLTKNTTF